MFVALSEAGWVTLGVAALAFAGTITTAVIGLFNRKEQRQTRSEIADAVVTNTADHGTVALALSRLTEEVKDNHRRNGERFERLGERMGEIATRQEKTNERIDQTNSRIDDVLTSQRDHIQHHLTERTHKTPTEDR